MSTIAGERGYGGERGDAFWQRGLDRLLAAELHLSVEAWLYVGLVLVAAVLRFTDLGSRALHHDESLHATYSWYFAQGRGYFHDPLMHGPLLFHITALVYLLFGASDATARFAPALFGTALVLVPLLLRPWLGRVGALAGATFLAFSPSLLYYSRFIRHDPFVIFFTLAITVCIFRYRASQWNGWLYVAALMLCLSFASMEITYYISLNLLLVLDGCIAARLAEQVAAHHDLDSRRRLGLFLVLLPVAWAVICAWPLIEEWRERHGLDEMPVDGPMLLVLGLLAAPQFSAGIRVVLQHLPLVHYDITQPVTINLFGHAVTRNEAVGTVTVLGLLALTMIVGWWWDPRRWFIAAAVFYIPYFLLFTTFLTNASLSHASGVTSGIWGALSYWLDQQTVQRGTQPVFYYGITLSSYEYLTLGLAAAGLVISAVRRGFDYAIFILLAFALIPVLAMADGHGHLFGIAITLTIIACATIATRGDGLRQLLVFYFGAIIFELSFSGEKMPWLTEHMALPLAMLAALAVNDVWGGFVSLPSRLRGLAAAALALAVAACAALAYLLAWKSASNGLLVAAALGAIVALVVAGVLLARALRRAEWTVPARIPAWAVGGVALAAFIGLFGALTVRADYRLNWIHPDTPDELLIYTQSSPDIPKVAKKIDELARESGLGKQLTITVDSNDAFTWPWAWYLRNYPKTGFPDLSAYASNPSAAAGLNPGKVLIVNAQDVAVVTQFAGQYDGGARLHHRWWFPEGYKGTTTQTFFERLRDGSELKRWWGYITNRDGYGVTSSDISPRPVPQQNGQPAIVTGGTANGKEYLGSVDSYVYFPANWTPGVGFSGAATAPAATPRLSGSTLTMGSFGVQPGQFNRPTDLAFDASGDLIVADSLNNRIEKFDAQGNLLATAAQGGPLAFHEPWGVAADTAGNVYVSDTWNHRIVKLDANLQFVKAWGQLAVNGRPNSPLDLYGPRGIAVDKDGSIWVADTGDARIVHFDANGNPLGAFGSRGSAPGQFNEPVGLAIAQDGAIIVADTWNNRIQIFDHSFQPLGEIHSDQLTWVQSAADQTQVNKPFVAALPDGTILASFPGADPVARPDQVALVRFDRQGRVLFDSRQLPDVPSPLRQPIGVAADAAGNVAVSDGLLSEVFRLPASELSSR